MLRLLSLVALSGLLAAAPDEPKKTLPQKIKLGEDTTFIDEPLDKDGFVDYEIALNTRLKGRTTPDTNAVVLLLKAIGPKPEGANLKADFYKALGSAEPPENGEYLVRHHSHFVLEVRAPDPQGFYDLETRLRRQPWTQDDAPKHSEWLKLNEKPLAIVADATKRPDYYYPIISRARGGGRDLLIGASLSMVQRHRELASILSLRATWNLGAGRLDAAFADVLTIHRLGRLISRGASMIEMLVGIAIEAIAVDCELTILEHGQPSAKQASAFQAELRKLPPRGSPADKIGLFEQFLFLDAVQDSVRTGNNLPAEIELQGKTPEQIADAIDWSVILRMGNGYYDRMEAAARLQTRIERTNANKLIDTDLSALPKKVQAITINAKDPPAKIRAQLSEKIGATFVGMLLPAVRKISEADDRAEQTFRNVLVASALAAYSADNKKYPEQLADLVPKYMAKVPSDVFNGGDVIYKKTDAGYLLYSVGSNAKDDGGTLLTDDSRGDDLGVRMPRK